MIDPHGFSLTLGAWMHDLSPFLVRISGDLGVRWYGVSYALGIALAWLWMRWMSRRGMTPLSTAQVGDLMTSLIVGVIVGGRLGYVLFYQPSLLWTFSGNAPWWGVLMLNKGGMASHGGILGVILAAFWSARAVRTSGTQVSGLHVLDLAAAVCPVGLMLGRLANFVNGELLGRVVAAPGEPAPWWAVKFPQEVISEHAVPLSEAQEQELVSLVRRAAPSVNDFEAGYSVLLDRVQHGGRELARELEPLISARHPSQLYQALTDGVLLAALLWLVWRVPRKPGVVGAWFLMGYGVMRVATEFWRLPDAGVTRVLGLSRGQQLSALMIVAGAAVLWVCSRRATEKLGGWSKAAPGGTG